MNDRAVSVLSEYDFEVLRTWKGRSAILFETPEGIRILKEYSGFSEKLMIQNRLLTHINENSEIKVEQIIPNKEGELCTKDQDQIRYVVKTYFEGRECNIRDAGECKRAVKQLARLHRSMKIPMEMEASYPVFRMDKEYEKHNRELKKVRRFLRDKSQKNDFEIYLLKYYDVFMNKAFQVAEEWRNYQSDKYEEDMVRNGIWCHGDYQYHNILFDGNDTHVINFEKCIIDSHVRDLYLFLRKLLEKNNWSEETGNRLLESYQTELELGKESRMQLYYRLAYPEKFWKIVNFYYNSGKAWIPGRNMEKLDKLLKQEDDKEKYIKKLLLS